MSKQAVWKVSSGVTGRLNAMVARSKATRAYLARNVYRQYQKAQQKRWQSEGASETGEWLALNAAYEKTKTKRFAKAPGAGNKMLIAEGRLVESVIGISIGAKKSGVGEHRLLVTDRMIAISVSTPYAQYVNELREFGKFGKATMKTIWEGLRSYIREGMFK